MKNFDERQKQVRGRIMTHAFLITIILMLLAAFLNDMHLYDFEGDVGFGETLISIVCITVTYGSVASILGSSYFGPLKDGRMTLIAYVFATLSVAQTALTIFDLIHGKRLIVMNIISLPMMFSISISLQIRRSDWKRQWIPCVCLHMCEENDKMVKQEEGQYMPLAAGIVGLPNVGKSTLFNTITKNRVETASYPFTATQPDVGVVEVSDYRVNHLMELFHSKKTIYTAFKFTDIAGLVKGADEGEGLGNQFLSNIRLTDTICHVVRCFDDADITHVEGSVDPIHDVEIISLELVMTDLQTIDDRLSKVERKAVTNRDKDALAKVVVLKKLKRALGAGKPARSAKLDKDELLSIKAFNLLTIKSMIYIVNMLDEETTDPQANPYFQKVKKLANLGYNEVVPVYAKIEEGLSELDKEEKTEFLNELGIQESGLDKVIKATYHILNLCTFLTAGEDECRAWIFHRGMLAPQRAGMIRTDFEKGFIRTECHKFDDVGKLETEQAVKKAGKLRLKGKEYVIQDEDALHFRLSVQKTEHLLMHFTYRM